MNASFFRHVASANLPLARLIQRFNRRLADDLDPAHLVGRMEPGLFGRLIAVPAARRQVNAWVEREFALPADGHWDFAEPRWRLALLPRPTMTALVDLTGAALLHRVFARTILRDDVVRLKADLGETLYTFATKKAPLLVTQPPAELEGATLEPDAREQVRRLGLRAIATCLADAPAALVARWDLKLPPDAPTRRLVRWPEEDRPRLAALVRRILLLDLAPELTPCFN